MSLYWPEQNVALEIVDDPASEPFDTVAHPDATVIRVTCTQIEDPEALDEVRPPARARHGIRPPPDRCRFGRTSQSPPPDAV